MAIPSLTSAAEQNVETGVWLLCKEFLVTAINDRRLERGHLRVLAAIVQMVNRHNAKAWPDRRLLAATAGMSMGAVSNALTELRRWGYLIADRERVEAARGREMVVYTLGNIDHETIRREIMAFVDRVRGEDRKTTESSPYTVNKTMAESSPYTVNMFNADHCSDEGTRTEYAREHSVSDGRDFGNKEQSSESSPYTVNKTMAESSPYTVNKKTTESSPYTVNKTMAEESAIDIDAYEYHAHGLGDFSECDADELKASMTDSSPYAVNKTMTESSPYAVKQGSPPLKKERSPPAPPLKKKLTPPQESKIYPHFCSDNGSNVSEPVAQGSDVDLFGNVVERGRARQRSTKLAATDEQWGRFWASYPRRTGKAKSQKLFMRLSYEDAELAIAAARRYAAECRRRGTKSDYVKFPEGWLNARRFEDYAVDGAASTLAESDQRDLSDDLAEARRLRGLEEFRFG